MKLIQKIAQGIVKYLLHTSKGKMLIFAIVEISIMLAFPLLLSVDMDETVKGLITLVVMVLAFVVYANLFIKEPKDE